MTDKEVFVDALLPNLVDHLRRQDPELFALIAAGASGHDAETRLDPFSHPRFGPELSTLTAKRSLDALRDSCDSEGQYRELIQNRDIGVVDLLRQRPQAIACYSRLRDQATALGNLLGQGNRCFYVADGLAQRLALTEANLACGEFYLPYAACQLVFTEPRVLRAAMAVVAATWHEEDFDLIFGEVCAGRPAQLCVVLSDTREPLDDGVRRILQVQAYLYFGSECWADGDEWLELRETWDLERAMRADVRYPDTPEFRRQRHIPLSEEADYFERRREFLRTVLNTVLYLDSEAAERTEVLSQHPKLQQRLSQATSAEKRRQIKKEIKRSTGADCIVLGTSLPALDLEAADAVVGRREGQPLRRRHWVRGHWRLLQSERYTLKKGKRVRIEPYRKGPDVAEEVKRPYWVTERQA